MLHHTFLSPALGRGETKASHPGNEGCFADSSREVGLCLPMPPLHACVSVGDSRSTRSSSADDADRKGSRVGCPFARERSTLQAPTGSAARTFTGVSQL
jgi:hypothetical protein